jgi:predicted neutral ceramidase superfamily lipid hydrolase
MRIERQLNEAIGAREQSDRLNEALREQVTEAKNNIAACATDLQTMEVRTS